jgi:polyisoprenoid-binding protein YceI
MKKVIYLFSFILFSSSVIAQNWSVDKSHSNVGFSLTHMLLSEVDGSFNDIEASFSSAKDDLSDAVFTFTAQMASVDTRIERRDTHLKSAEFFEVEKYATMTFKSTSFKKVEGKNYKIVGNLTIKGITKSVTLDVVLNGPIVHPRNNKKMVGIKATGHIDRFDFGVGGESGAVTSREVAIHANGEFSKD